MPFPYPRGQAWTRSRRGGAGRGAHGADGGPDPWAVLAVLRRAAHLAMSGPRRAAHGLVTDSRGAGDAAAAENCGVEPAGNAEGGLR